MDVKELLDDDAFEQKKLFNKEQFNTLIINREGFNKSENDLADLIETLLDTKITRQESEEIFTKLKEGNAQNLLVNAITTAVKTEEKAKLIAASWESGLDFTPHFLFFAELVGNDDFQVSMEALTVVENIESQIDESILTKALVMAQSAKSKNVDLVNELITNIKSRI